MPNRIIRDAILDSEKYDALQIEARLAFFEILLRADDYGLIPLHNLWLRRHCPAFDGRSVEFADGVLSALADQDLIRIYFVDGKRFAFIPQFGNRPQAIAPKYPLPPATLTNGAIEEAQKQAKNLPRTLKRLEYRNQGLSGIEHGSNPVPTPSESPETETETETEIQKKKIRAPRAASLPSAAPSGVSPEVWADFKTLRTKQRAPITATALAGIEREAAKAGLSLEDALRTCCERGWRGFKADWLVDTSGSGKTPLGRSGKPEEPSRYARPGLMGKMKELERRALEAKETER